MNKDNLFLLVVLLVFGGVGMMILRQHPVRHEPTNADQKPVYKIALLTGSMEYHSAVNEGFFKALKADDSATYEVDVYDFQRGDHLFMKEVANAVVFKDYNAIVTVGARFSQMMAHVLKRRRSDIPMIFIGVANPVETVCIDSEEAPGRPITGVRSADDLLDMQARVLHLLAPSLKTVLIVYDATTDMGKEQAEFEAMERYFTTHGVVVRSRMVDQPGTTMSIIRQDLDYVDAMMIVEGGAATADYTGVIRLCERYKVLFCAGDVGTIDHGAAIAFGPEPQYAGQRGFLKTRAILQGEIDPRTTPVERVARARRIALNLTACRRVGFEPDPLMVYALDRGKVIE